jgi:hypothetical protein
MCILFEMVFTKLLGWWTYVPSRAATHELVVQHYDPLLELIIRMLALLIMWSIIYGCRLVILYRVKHLVSIYGQLGKLTKKVGGDHIQQTWCNQTSTNCMEPNNLQNMDFYRANPTSNQSGPRKPSIKTTRLEEGDFYFITVSLKLYQHQSKSKNNLSTPWDTRIISPLPHRQRGKVIGSVHDN